MTEWNILDDLEQLDQIQDQSFTRPQALFKHSTTCSISHMAKHRMDTTWDVSDVDLYYLDLKAYRTISNAIAERWTVQHESPQLIVLYKGNVVYTDSHLDIDVNQVKQSLLQPES